MSDICANSRKKIVLGQKLDSKLKIGSDFVLAWGRLDSQQLVDHLRHRNSVKMPWKFFANCEIRRKTEY